MIGAEAVLNSEFGGSRSPMLIFESDCKPTDRLFKQCEVDYFYYGHDRCNQFHIAGVRCEGA